MRASSTVVVFSSLLLAVSAVAGPNDGKGAAPAKGSAPAAGSAKGATPAAGSAKGATPGSATPAAGPATPATPAPGSAAPTTTASADPDPASVLPGDMPTPVRMRRLEQRTQALKERAWQLKARVQMLKEQMLGGGVGAQTLISHANDMGSSFRLIKLIYSLDGTQVFVRTDDSGENLYKTKSFDIFSGPIAPGNHNIGAVATYRGHGYGVFEYLSKYTFTAKGGQAFTAGEGKIAKVDCKGYEKGGPTTPLEKRASIDCKVTQVTPEKPPEKPAPAAAPTGAGVPTTTPTSGAPVTPAPAAAPPAATPAPAAAPPATKPATPAPAPATKPGK